MSDEYVDDAKQEISQWESAKPGFLANVGDVMLWPAQKAAEMLIPDVLHEQVANAIEIFFSGADWTARKSFDPSEVRERVGKRPKNWEDELKKADEAAAHYWNWNVGYGVAEGGTTGALGLPGLVADIPALFTIALRLIQQIGTCYGYDVDDEKEREYILHILRTGSTGDIKSKMGFVIGLKQLEQILLKVAWKEMSAALASKQISKQAALAAVRQFAKSLGIQITKRKALQMVPVVGALVGASFNGTFINDVGRAAYMNYRRRWIAEQEHVVDGKVKKTPRQPRKRSS